MERDKPKKSESVGQTWPLEIKKGGFFIFLFLSSNFMKHRRNIHRMETFGVLIKFKMADVAMVTKVQKLLNLFQTSRNFTIMFLVACRFANRDIKFQNGCS